MKIGASIPIVAAIFYFGVNGSVQAADKVVISHSGRSYTKWTSPLMSAGAVTWLRISI
jgi:hypothetical protein